MFDYEKELFKWDMEEFYKSRKQFMDETNHNDNLVIILRAHLYIEQELNNLIIKVMKNPKKLKARYYADKLDLAYSLGLIESPLYSSLVKLNKIRNAYAHTIGYEITEEDFDDLMAPFSKKHLEEYEKDLFVYAFEEGERTLQIKLRVLLSLLWADTRICVLHAFLKMKERIHHFDMHELDRLWKIALDDPNTDVTWAKIIAMNEQSDKK